MQLPPTSISTASGVYPLPFAAATTSGTARPPTPIHSHVQAPVPSAASFLVAQSLSEDASAASASALIPSNANLQEQSANDELFAHDTDTMFDLSAYSDILDHWLSNMCTTVVPGTARAAQSEAYRKKSSEPFAKYKHHHSRSKRACGNLPIKSITPAAHSSSPSKHPPGPIRGIFFRSTKYLLAAHHVAKLPNKQMLCAVQLAKSALRLTGMTRVKQSAIGPALLRSQALRLQQSAVDTYSSHCQVSRPSLMTKIQQRRETARGTLERLPTTKHDKFRAAGALALLL